MNMSAAVAEIAIAINAINNLFFGFLKEVKLPEERNPDGKGPVRGFDLISPIYSHQRP
ncbi:hypothetical protein [Thermophagus xiamenensis]|uniref:hypothetical protein n=1 Tax=Thermophagus xiamenensis TaxID=385682 RepID=UPI000310B221|nr:hypothetical protein [Thermophagus xiamenensis]